MNCALSSEMEANPAAKKEKFQEKNFFKDKNRVLNVYIDVLTFQKGNLCTIFCLVEMRKF